MSWADRTIDELRAGRIAQCRPHGGSMRGRIESGQLVTLDPSLEPEVGDAVLCRCRGAVYVHIVKARRGSAEAQSFLIGNNRGGINGWVRRSAIFGVVTRVED
jgi:hypothetical protein